ncbi:MAG: elongation factor EF-2 [Candidatus Aenigmatarchaeota archaeon]
MSEKKSMIDRIKEVMYDPKRIRNVATSSHVHHGKCVSRDALIFLEKETMTAENLFNILKNKGRLMIKNEIEEVYEISDELYALTYNNGSISKSKLTHIWKIKNDDILIEIKVKDGRRVKVTPEHKFIVLKNGEIIEVEARNLKIGEKLILPAIIPNCSMNLDIIKEKFLEKLSEDYNFLAYLLPDFGKVLHQKIIKYGMKTVWEKIGSKISMLSFYHCVRKNRYRLTDLVKIAKLFVIKLDYVYNNIAYLSYRKSLKRLSKIKLPKSEEEFEEFFYLLGLLLKERSVNSTKEISKKVLGITFSLRNSWLLLNKLFGYSLKAKARNLKVPTIFFNLPKNFVLNFIKGYFDTKFSISSKNEKVLEELQLLLLRFGCLSYIEKDTKFNEYSLNISGRKDLEKFLNFISFDTEYKQKDLLKLYENASISKVFNLNSFIQISESPIIALEISEIRKVKNEKYVYDFTVEETHNFIANGIFVHNTTLTDNLMAGAGMLAEEMAGKVMFTWFDEQERKRELTIYGANVSMVHEYEGKDYLINLVDTPGHVDFGGDVTRAMRAVDGTIVLVDAVEGIMPQTETVFRQALRERVKPILFINKTDRLIKELKVSPQQMMERLEKIIKDVNILIQRFAEEPFNKEWLVSVQDGSVAIGSAYRRWAISLPYLQKTGITLKEIMQLSSEGRDDELAKLAPLHRVVLDMIIKHLPDPLEAIKYRLEKIWKGDLNSEIAKDMLECNPNGRLAIIITKMIPDPHVGFVATGRIFSGKVYKGKDVYLLTSKKQEKIQQVAIFKGIQRIPVDEVVAGNIVAIVGIPQAFTGETVCEPDKIIEPFVEIKHLFEPVVTKSVEPKNPMDLTRVVEALKQIAREDPTLVVKINPETGEYLVSGMGELHLEAKVENKLKEMGLDVVMSPPIVVYRETVESASSVVESKTPNKHNRLYFIVEPLEDKLYEALIKGEIPEIDPREKDIKLFKKISEYGIPYDTAKKIVSIYNKCVLIEETRGQLFVREIIEMVKDAFKEVCDDGPLAREPLMKVKVRLVDCDLHEDSIHRGPGQIMPATKYGIRQAMLKAGVVLMEPKQILRIDAPSEYISEIVREIENRRGSLLDMKEEAGATQIIAKIPVSEIFGFDAKLKSITSGRGFYSLIENVFEKISTDLRDAIVKSIRKRKGLPEEIPKPEV